MKKNVNDPKSKAEGKEHKTEKKAATKQPTGQSSAAKQSSTPAKKK